MRTRTRAPMALGGGLLAVALTTGPALAAGGGWLDPTFGTRGVVRVGSPVSGYTRADHLVVRVGPTGRIFLFEDMSSGDTADSAFLRARTSTGGRLTAFNGGTIPYLGSSGDLAVYNVGLAPLADGGVIYGTINGDVIHPTIKFVHRASDGHVVASRSGLPGILNAMEDRVAPFTRLPGGSIRACVEAVVDVGPPATRLTGLTPALTLDVLLGPDGYHAIDLAHCSGITSDAAGQIYIAGPTTVDSHLAIEVEALTSSGSLITTWGDNGHRVIALAGTDLAVSGTCSWFEQSRLRALADGTVIVALDVRTANTCVPAAAGVARITPSGGLDAGFSGDGIATFGPASGRSTLFAIDTDTAGRVILSLGYYPTGGTPKPYIGRVTTTGILDPTFGFGGLVPVTRAPRDLDVDGSNRIVSVTSDGADVIMTRRKG
jgi:hypothetical protein